ncbi:hypothetical protein ELG76_04085 [Rhizobium leguminosarum]|uniref:hypothetical protein n=1 Tax=Rhizobium leguminosarum TaxID=384 RepID=UPI001030B731|nr:hypothetical protein [Rhizobium leguminosarum]TBG78599.1 hypothetical protein ELG76_04085 [Rhizobium leguminosarum]
MSTWHDLAVERIRELDATLPADMPIKERRKAVQAAYSFGPRKYWPYKAWCKAQREYLNRFLKSDAAVPEKHLSPLERMMKRAGQ